MTELELPDKQAEPVGIELKPDAPIESETVVEIEDQEELLLEPTSTGATEKDEPIISPDYEDADKLSEKVDSVVENEKVNDSIETTPEVPSINLPGAEASAPTNQTEISCVPFKSEEEDDDPDAVLISSSDLIGHDPTLDSPVSSKRSKKGVESLAKRMSLKGVGTSLRKSGSIKSDDSSYRGSIDVDKRGSLDMVSEAQKADGVSEPATPALSEASKSGASTPVGGAGAARPAFRARVSASAEGVKRAVMGARKESTGSLKKVDGSLDSFLKNRLLPDVIPIV
jgi:hypothetical protein